MWEGQVPERIWTLAIGEAVSALSKPTVSSFFGIFGRGTMFLFIVCVCVRVCVCVCVIFRLTNIGIPLIKIRRSHDRMLMILDNYIIQTRQRNITQVYLHIPKYPMIQHAKLHIDRLKLNTTILHCKEIPLLLNKGVQIKTHLGTVYPMVSITFRAIRLCKFHFSIDMATTYPPRYSIMIS